MHTDTTLPVLPNDYPVEWIEPLRLADGRQLMLRPILPQDDVMERLFVAEGLTQHSRYQRFQVGLSRLPDALVRSFTQIDYHAHFALVAYVPGADAQLQAGDARFVRDGALSPRAEFALAVADAWQGQGLGRHLMCRLMQAARLHGIDELYGDVLRDNTGMLALAAEQGFVVQRHPTDATLVRVQRRTLPRDVRPACPAGLSPAAS